MYQVRIISKSFRTIEKYQGESYMRYLKRFNTVFYKLFISYITITITITVLLGSTSYLYFSANYKEQLIKVNDKMLQYEKNYLELSVIQKVESLYVALSTKQLNPYFTDTLYLFDHSAEGNQSKIYNISEHLKNTFASNSSLIDSVHLYIPYSNIIISSTWGIKYLNEDSGKAAASIDWFKELDAPPLNGKWIDTRPITNSFSTGYSFNGFTYLRVYPMFSNNISNPGLIAIDVSATTIDNILKDLNTSSSKNTFIVNNSGKVIFHPDSSKLFSDLNSAPFMREILDNKKDSDNFISKVNKVSSMISYTTIGNTGWRIVTYTPVNEFYKQSIIIQQVILALCALAIIIGFILTNIFSAKMYNPLKSLLHLTKSLFTGEPQSDKDNEYALINNVINKLSYKVTELEKNIIEYQPIVKHNLIRSLFNNSIASEDELSQRLNLANIYMETPYYVCIIVKLDTNHVNSIGIQNSHYARYNIIKFIEGMSNDTALILAIELSCTSIGVVISSKQNIDPIISEMIDNTINFSLVNFNMPLTFSVSNWTDSPLGLSNSYEEASSAAKYKFYYSGNNVIFYRNIALREAGNERNSSLSTEDCIHAIKLQDMDGVTLALNRLIDIITTGNFSADYSKKKLLDLVDGFCIFANSLNLESYSNNERFYSEFEKLKDINEFRQWFINHIRVIIELLEERNSTRNTDVIEKVKEYINSNLGNQLSLESAASSVNLNPKYLSKLFKEITGVNFLDYITELRLEKSKSLLLSTNLTIEQISYEIGYNTPAYFIRQFKKTYGETPNNYKKICSLKTTV